MKCKVCNRKFVPARDTQRTACRLCTVALFARRKMQGGRQASTVPTPPHIEARVVAMTARAALGLPLFTGRRI